MRAEGERLPAVAEIASRTLALVNPMARGGRAAEVWRALQAADSRLAEVRVVQTSSPEAARAALMPLLDSGADRLIVVGGDGSVHHAVNLLIESGRAAEIGLGLVPVGTGSDLARTLGIPADPSRAVDRLLAAAPRPIDAIELTTADGRRRFVVNVASSGISGLVDAAVRALPKASATAYLKATLGAFWRYRPVACRVTVDGEPWYQGEIFLLAMANGRCFGNGMRIAPEAELDDGLGDIVLVQPLPTWQLPLRLPQIYRGTHLGSRYVRWRRGRCLEIEPLAPLPPFDLDGDVFEADGATLTMRPAALRLLA